MKKILSVVCLCLGVLAAAAQTKIDEERMERDIEVAENVLGTLIKQQLGRRNFFPYEVNGSYTPGFGVTFRLPSDMGTRMIYEMRLDPMNAAMEEANENFNISITAPEPPATIDLIGDECEDCPKAKKAKTTTVRARTSSGKAYTSKLSSKISGDSASASFNQKLIEASRNFIADYGDLISQLGPDEKILITNRNEGLQMWGFGDRQPKRRLLTMDITRKDITTFRTGKMTRDQLIAKINVVDSETSSDLSPDIELLSSIFNRLYRPDLSKTYYTQGNLNYERLKNFGVIFYLTVFSSNEMDDDLFSLPTQNLEGVDKATRDKKVTELYPTFEKELKENIVDYGRTLKSLNAEELLSFNVTLTRCAGCGIPKTVELSLKNSVLQDFGSGKITREAAVAKITVKKGPAQ